MRGVRDLETQRAEIQVGRPSDISWLQEVPTTHIHSSEKLYQWILTHGQVHLKSGQIRNFVSSTLDLFNVVQTEPQDCNFFQDILNGKKNDEF